MNTDDSPLTITRGIQLIAEALKEDQPRSDTLRFLLFQADSIHVDLNRGQQLTDAKWIRNPNGTVAIERPKETEDTTQPLKSDFIIPATTPELIKAQPDVPQEAIGYINYVIDRFERDKPPGGVVLLSAGMSQPSYDWQMALYTSVTRENAYQLALKGTNSEESDYKPVDFEALYNAGTRFFAEDTHLETVKEAIAAPDRQELRQNRPFDEAVLEHVFPREKALKAKLEAPSADLMGQLVALGLKPKQ